MTTLAGLKPHVAAAHMVCLCFIAFRRCVQSYVPVMFRNVDTSSSSEDEISAAALREACDDKFLPDSLFSKKDSSTPTHYKPQEINDEIKPSLRITERSDAFETFGVSQSFKDFVAKKLDDKLERNIELQDGSNSEEEVIKKKKKKKKKKQGINLEAGIKLLSESSETLINVEIPKEERHKQTIKPWKFSKESEAKNVEKCQDVAVNPEWILSKTETKSWNEKQKGSVFKYKKGSNGVLMEQQ